MHITKPIALLALAAAAVAQGPLIILGCTQNGGTHSGPATDDSDPFVIGKIRTWTDPTAPIGPFSRTVVGRVTGSGVADVVALDGSHAVVLAAPSIHTTVCQLSGTAGMVIRDAAVLVGGHLGGAPMHDALAMCGPAGLSLWHSGKPYTIETVSSAWSGVDRVATHELDTSVIYGAESNGTLRCAVKQNGVFTTTAMPTAFSGTLLDLATIDWNGDSLAEAAVLTTSGLYVVSRTGQCLVSYTGTGYAGSYGDICLIQSVTFGPHDSIAWLHTNSGGQQVVTLCNSAAAPVDSLLYPRSNPFVGITAGHFLPGTNDDLILSSLNNDTVTVLGRQTSGTPFLHDTSGGFAIAVSATGQCDANAAAPAVADFNADGDLDILQLRTEGDTPTGMLLDMKYYYRSYRSPLVPFGIAGDIETYTFQPVPTATHTQFLVWGFNGDNLTMQTTVCSALEPTTATLQSVTLPIAEFLDEETGNNVVVVVRPVQVSAGHIVQVGEASLYTLRLPPGRTGSPDLPPIDPLPWTPPTGGGSGGEPVPPEGG